ncbi:MAG: hypothetical protein KDI46_00380 [Alphaproteobacteria bacterium]|nr:hypothetical protein [Alphaproteobacteria bacterium]
MEPPFFEIPLLLTILCFSLGLSALFSQLSWLNSVQKGLDIPLWRFVGANVARVGVFLAFFSFLYYFWAGGFGFPWPEVLILFVALSGVVLYEYFQGQTEHNGPVGPKHWVAGLYRGIDSLLLFVCMLGVFGAVIVVFLMCLSLVLMNLALLVPLPFSPLEGTVFSGGGGWFFALFWMYRQAVRQRGEDWALKNRFSGLLPPFALALVCFIVPLLLYKLSYDVEFHERLHRVPPLFRV